MGRFDGKVAFITGSGRGMGRSHAVMLASGGCDVVVHDINAEWAEKTARMVRDQGRRALVCIADVANPDAMADAVGRAEREFGRIDILINNAGISAERAGIDGVSVEHFDRMFAIHVKGTFFTTKAVVPGMKERRYGKIVNISSIWGMTGHKFGSTYCAAKAALLGLTKSWAKEFAPWAITVNSVAPGAVKTEMQLEADGQEKMLEYIKGIPLSRFAEVEEMSYAVLFLASDESNFITGQVLSPNGGDTIVGI